MTIESNRTLGGIGAILLLIFPFAGIYTSILGLVGLILVLIALNGLANEYVERRIFNNAIYGIIITIVGAIVAVALIVTAAFGILSVLGIQVSSWTDWSALQNINVQNFTNWSAIAPYIAAIVGALAILFACAVVGTFLLRRSLNVLSEKSGVHLFATTGLLMLIGAVLTIIAVGFILLWVSLILLAVAFFETKTQPKQAQTTQPPRPP
jgi:uncharacterized membrane protein